MTDTSQNDRSRPNDAPPAARRRWHVPPRRLVLWSTVSALPMAGIVVVGALLSWHYHGLLNESRERVDHTYEVLRTVNGLFIRLEDAETGQRGYVITGRDDYLAPYLEARRAVPDHYPPLYALVADSAEQTARVQRLQTLVTAQLADLERSVALRHHEGFDAARRWLETGRGKALMDAIRVEVDAVVRAEEALLVRRRAVAAARENDILKLAALVAVVSVAMRLGLAWTLKRWRRRAAALADV